MKKYTKNQEASSILRVDFALSNWPHLHRAYLVTVPKYFSLSAHRQWIMLYTASNKSNGCGSSSSSWIKIHGNVRTWSVKNNEWLHTSMLDYSNLGCRVFKMSYIFIIYLWSKESFSQTVKQVTTKCRVWEIKTNILQRQKKIYTF